MEFGKIVCHELRVIDDEGKVSVTLEAIPNYGGVVRAYGKDGASAQLPNNRYGGIVTAYGKDGSIAEMGNNEYGGVVTARGKDSGKVQLSNDTYGGVMAICNKDKTTFVLQASVGTRGGGILETYDMLGNRTGRLP